MTAPINTHPPDYPPEFEYLYSHAARRCAYSIEYQLSVLRLTEHPTSIRDFLGELLNLVRRHQRSLPDAPPYASPSNSESTQ